MAARPILASVLLVAVLVASAAPTRAADLESARAEELIRQANALRQRGQDPAALPLFREAYDVARSPRTAAQLGLVELALGYWVSAEDHLTEALAPADHPWIERNREVLEKARAKAQGHVVTLLIEGQPVGADVRVNASGAGKLPLPAPIRVSEGTVTVEVTAAGHEDARRTVILRSGSAERLRFDLIPINSHAPVEIRNQLVTAPSPSPSATNDLPPWRRLLPWTFVGGTVIAATVGVWQHVAWRNSQSDFEAIDDCGADRPNHGSDPSCNGLYATLATHRTRAYISYGAAFGLGAAAALTVIVNGSSNSRETSFGPGPTAFGASIGRRF
jgi:hypothetical protein